MSGARATGLAGQVIAFAERTQEASRPLLKLKLDLHKRGEDFYDTVDQCDVIARLLDRASEAMLVLASMILKADKVSASARDEAASSSTPQTSDSRPEDESDA